MRIKLLRTICSPEGTWHQDREAECSDAMGRALIEVGAAVALDGPAPPVLEAAALEAPPEAAMLPPPTRRPVGGSPPQRRKA